MLRRSLVALLALLLGSCVAEPTRSSWNYEIISTQPTPQHWKPDSVWTFVMTPQSGTPRTLTFRVTDDTADTCISGDWRKLELVEGQSGSFAGTPSKAAYEVQGRFLWISLNSNWCDANDDVRGELYGGRFKGERSVGGITGSSEIATVQGWRVR